MINRATLVTQARSLRTDDGDHNPEYDRALCELAWRTLLSVGDAEPFDDDAYDALRKEILES